MPSNKIEENLSCFSVRLSPSDKLDLSVSGKKLVPGSVMVGEWYSVEILSSIVGRVHLVVSNPDLNSFSKELSWSHQ